MKGLVAVSLAFGLVRIAAGADLIEVYQDALRFDPQIREAEAQYKAAREQNPQALAALLPQLSGSASLSRQKEGYVSVFPEPIGPGEPLALFGENTIQYVNTRQFGLQLQQTVFSWPQFATLAEAHKKVAQALADYRSAQQSLIQRVATAYFNVLNAQDTLDAEQASLDALSRQLEQANKRFEVGLIAITDVKEAEAQHDAAAAAVIQDKRNLASTQEQLREITDQDYTSMAKPGEDMPLLTPRPADVQRWIDMSMDQNLSLVSSRLAADAARDNVQVAFGGHLPSISITAQDMREHQDTDESLLFSAVGVPPLGGRTTFPTGISNGEIALQVTVPLFSGGLVQSQVRQAQYQWIEAKDHVVTISRQTEYQARDAYNAVVSEIAQVSALKQGVVSAEVALKATEAGYEVGTRTEVDVLTERENLVQAQTNYAQARYAYLNAIVQLQLAAGTLDVNTLEQINGWLTLHQPEPELPGTPRAPVAPPEP
ncbi:MAG TPA: TolC family outer membrane protein [Steroidobacteraceae bacterium]|nr:TolC family outer membrane protein [Steroidobacteraceae bacterium]